MKKIIGYNGTEISVKEQNDFNEAIGVIYPGQSYYLSAPSLFYLQPIFEELKIHYFGIDLQYGNSDYIKLNSDDKEKWLNSDSELIGQYVNENTKEYKQRIFIAKSLGTGHLYNQLNSNYINKNDILVFQTPVIPYNELQKVLIEKGNTSLIIYGTNDSIMKREKFPNIKAIKNVEVIKIENAGHSFEEDNKIEESINNLKYVMLGIDSFLTKNLAVQQKFLLTTAST